MISAKKTNGSNNHKPHNPVLIIPGFMSSGLTIKKSTQSKSWEGKRLWLNITSAGFNSLHVGGALRKNEHQRSIHNMKVKDALPPYKAREEMHEQYLKEVECKSKWVRHMRLKDMVHEPEGIVVVSIVLYNVCCV